MNIRSKKMYVIVAAFIIALDQLVKYYVINSLSHYTFNDFFSIDLVFNRGISWGLLHSDNPTVFACVNSAVLFVIGSLIVHSIVRMIQRHCIIGEVMVFAGAVSNYIDRYYYHGVVDFISIAYQDWCFPVFNLADIFIVCGVMLMLFLQWRKPS